MRGGGRRLGVRRGWAAGAVGGLLLVLAISACGGDDGADERRSSAERNAPGRDSTLPTTTSSTVATTTGATSAPPTTASTTTSTTEPASTAPPPTDPPATEPPPTEPPATEPPPTLEDGKAPWGQTQVGVWWSPGADQFSASNLWFFDPVSEALPYGSKTGYQPIGGVPSIGDQRPFVYSGGAGSYQLEYSSSGTIQSLVLTGYDPGSDTLSVEWEGLVETWYGCSSGQMPAVALAAC